MALSTGKNIGAKKNILHLEKISQIGGRNDFCIKTKGETKQVNTSRSYLSKKDTTFSLNSRDTTLETHQTQDVDENTKRLIEKEVEAILEGEFDDQQSSFSKVQEFQKQKAKKNLKISYKKLNRTPGIIGYLSYLNDADNSGIERFRSRLKEREKALELNHSTPAIQRNDSILGSKLRSVIMQRQEPNTTADGLTRSRNNSKEPPKTPRRLDLSSSSNRKPTLSRENSFPVKTEKIAKERLKEMLQNLAKEFEIFINHSSKEGNIYEKMKDYILDKPEIRKIFFNNKSQRFKESVSHNEIYKSMVLEIEGSGRGSVWNNRRESNATPLFRRKSTLNVIVKIPERLSEQMKFFMVELQEVNLHYQLQEIVSLGDRVSQNESIIQNKYYKLAKRLYNIDRSYYHKFCDVINQIQNDRPYLRIRLQDKLTDFEKHVGELPLILPRAREIGKAWDNLLMKWTNTREKIIITDNS